MTWTCHICKETRPDDKISVLSKVTVLSGGVPVTENIRYCNDKVECVEGAKTFSHFATKK
ncbi:hypothetical protein LCGC14_1599520 [marine sediment metagenome]|uniref:Uncharacterized protein n=1 Tax=marine sediment metagenome TaxID=412755 RepID=A0A0F9IBX8_9ZZZZ